MKKNWQIIVLGTVVCLFPFQASLADEFGKLENLLNKVDESKYFGEPKNTMQPPVTPVPQAFAPEQNSYMRPGMPYSSETISALQHSAVWKYMSNPAYAGAPAGQPGGNPFNLSPFGMLHYLWDDTNYVSAANPVTLYQTQSELQAAQHYSQLAQAASNRVRYARSPQERDQAAQQAQYYAKMAKQAAQSAQQVSQTGSLDPADVARAAAEQASAAANYANQASTYAGRGF